MQIEEITYLQYAENVFNGEPSACFNISFDRFTPILERLGPEVLYPKMICDEPVDHIVYFGLLLAAQDGEI